jgi:hypothetical protein
LVQPTNYQLSQNDKILHVVMVAGKYWALDLALAGWKESQLRVC